jgi:four helix bundle protein
VQTRRMQNFRELRVWQRAHAFVLDTRKVTNGFPRTGYSELKSQLIRAAESIPCNIVEGCAAATRKEFARYLDISIKSTSEVEYQLLLATDYGLITRAVSNKLTVELIEIRKMLCALRRAVLDAEGVVPPRKADRR